ncbi:MAG: hypothetical protein ACWGQW_01275 [bacterium]
MRDTLSSLIEQAQILGFGVDEGVKVVKEETDKETTGEKTVMISLERHVQTLVLALLLASILWGTNSLIDLKTKVEVFDVKLNNIQNVQASAVQEQSKRIDAMEQLLKNTRENMYHSQDAIRDFSLRDGKIAAMEGNCRNVESQLNEIKRDITIFQQMARHYHPEDFKALRGPYSGYLPEE